MIEQDLGASTGYEAEIDADDQYFSAARRMTDGDDI